MNLTSVQISKVWAKRWAQEEMSEIGAVPQATDKTFEEFAPTKRSK